MRDGRVLVARRAPGQRLAGYWEFPGGKVEPGETVAACIERELAEELSIAGEAGEVVARHLHRDTAGAINLIAVRVTLKDGADDGWQLRVHDAVRWVEPAALTTFRLAPADIPIADAVRASLA